MLAEENTNEIMTTEYMGAKNEVVILINAEENTNEIMIVKTLVYLIQNPGVLDKI
jgi:hypothetical protein